VDAHADRRRPAAAGPRCALRRDHLGVAVTTSRAERASPMPRTRLPPRPA
jgi:hypothetical protein